MRALLWGGLVGLLWVLFPTVLAAAVAVALAVLVKAAPAVLLLAVLARTVPAWVRRWAR